MIITQYDIIYMIERVGGSKMNCPKCNEEFEHYVELCPNCGKIIK